MGWQQDVRASTLEYPSEKSQNWRKIPKIDKSRKVAGSSHAIRKYGLNGVQTILVKIGRGKKSTKLKNGAGVVFWFFKCDDTIFEHHGVLSIQSMGTSSKLKTGPN